MSEKVSENCEVLVFSRIVARPEHLEEVRSAYNRALSPELRQAGCSRYECYQDLNQENALLALGVWQSESRFEHHLLTVHDSLAAINRLLLSPPEMRVVQYVGSAPEMNGPRQPTESTGV